MISRVPRHAPGNAERISRRGVTAALDAPHFGGQVTTEPGAFVCTDVLVSVPFENAPWRDCNPVLREQKGLLSKVWLSEHTTNTLGGLNSRYYH